MQPYISGFEVKEVNAKLAFVNILLTEDGHKLFKDQPINAKKQQKKANKELLSAKAQKKKMMQIDYQE